MQLRLTESSCQVYVSALSGQDEVQRTERAFASGLPLIRHYSDFDKAFSLLTDTVVRMLHGHSIQPTQVEELAADRVHSRDLLPIVLRRDRRNG